MPRIAIITGILLFALGPIFYNLSVSAGHNGKTAFIASVFGIFIAAGGAAALNPARVKAGMHISAMFGLLGILGSLMGAPKWIAFLTGGEVERPLAALEQFLMFVICLVFVVLCVRWFISNRKARLAA